MSLSNHYARHNHSEIPAEKRGREARNGEKAERCNLFANDYGVLTLPKRKDSFSRSNKQKTCLAANLGEAFNYKKEHKRKAERKGEAGKK